MMACGKVRPRTERTPAEERLRRELPEGDVLPGCRGTGEQRAALLPRRGRTCSSSSAAAAGVAGGAAGGGGGGGVAPRSLLERSDSLLEVLAEASGEPAPVGARLRFIAQARVCHVSPEMRLLRRW